MSSWYENQHPQSSKYFPISTKTAQATIDVFRVQNENFINNNVNFNLASLIKNSREIFKKLRKFGIQESEFSHFETKGLTYHSHSNSYGSVLAKHFW